MLETEDGALDAMYVDDEQVVDYIFLYELARAWLGTSGLEVTVQV